MYLIWCLNNCCFGEGDVYFIICLVYMRIYIYLQIVVHKIANECKYIMNSCVIMSVSIYKMHKLIILVLFDMYLLSGHANYVTSVALSADGSKVVSGSDDKTVKIWSADSGEVLQTLSGDIDMKHICILCRI